MTKMKICNECARELPDNGDHFLMRIKKGGIWGTSAKCKKCYAERRRTRYLVKKIEAMIHAEEEKKNAICG